MNVQIFAVTGKVKHSETPEVIYFERVLQKLIEINGSCNVQNYIEFLSQHFSDSRSESNVLFGDITFDTLNLLLYHLVELFFSK